VALQHATVPKDISRRWPSRDRPALEEQVGLLFGWKPARRKRLLQRRPICHEANLSLSNPAAVPIPNVGAAFGLLTWWRRFNGVLKPIIL